jgi:hypothetical protein
MTIEEIEQHCVECTAASWWSALYLKGVFRAELLVDTTAAATTITPQTAERLGIELQHPLRRDKVATAHSRRLVAWQLAPFVLIRVRHNNAGLALVARSALLHVGV